MISRRSTAAALLIAFATAGALAHAAPQGRGQLPTPYPLANPIRERGSSITGAFEGWYYEKDGSVRLLVGYFNRNTKQELDIPVGPDNRIEPGGPDQGQPTHFLAGRQFGVFSIKVPKDFGAKELTWTLVANGQTNTITLHTKAEWIVEPFLDPASRNTPPSVRLQPGGPAFAGPPRDVAAALVTDVATPLPLTVWASDEGPTVNVPEPTASRARGRGSLIPPLSVAWSLFRGPAAVTIDPVKPPVDKTASGKATATATFSAPGEYILRLQANDQTGDGGSGFQCCWTNTYVSVTVKPSRISYP